MSNKAQVLVDEIPVIHTVRPEVQREYLTINVPNDWDDVKKICKKVLMFEGKRFTFTGWDSDRHVCMFVRPIGQDAPTAKIVRK